MLRNDRYAVYRAMFGAAAREMRVFTGRADMDYADDFISAACEYLTDQNHSLKIACQCGADRMGQCRILKALLAFPKRQGALTVYDASNYHDVPYFITADRDGYRLQWDDNAMVNFGDPETTERLYGHFGEIAANSTVWVNEKSRGLQ